MAELLIPGYQCDVCGHSWLPRAGFPLQCARNECKSRKWNSKGLKLSKRIETHVMRDSPKMNDAMAKFMTKAPIIDPEPVERVMCRYSEYDQDTGETMACGLPSHSMKQKHSNWFRV